MSPIRENITRHIYGRMFLTSSLTTFTLIGAGFIDSVIISHYLGSNAIAAAGLAYPFYSLAGIVHGCLATGFKSIASRSLTQGNTIGFQRIFSLCVTISAIVSMAAVTLLIVFAGPLSFLFGARNNSAELLDMTKSYLTGLSIGFPALVFNTLLSTSLQFDNGIDYIGKAHITGMITDIALDLLAVNMGLGLFAIGLASSVSAYVYYARKKQSLHITVDDYLHVEDECDISPGDIIDLGVRTQDECSLTAEQVRLEYPIELKHFRSMDVENLIIIM